MLALILVVGACGGGDSPPPADLARQGPYAVGFTSLTFTDTSRREDGKPFGYRPVPVLVWYVMTAASVGPDAPEARYPIDPFYGQFPPAGSSLWEKYGTDRALHEPLPAPGRFPVILFSHGHGMPQYNVALGTRLASHGFVFVAVMHFGDPSQMPGYPPGNSMRSNMYDRPRDLSFALTELLARSEQPGQLLHGVLDPDHVAAAGFSLGGSPRWRSPPASTTTATSRTRRWPPGSGRDGPTIAAARCPAIHA